MDWSALPLLQQIEFGVNIRAVRGKHFLPLGPSHAHALRSMGKGSRVSMKIIYQI